MGIYLIGRRITVEQWQAVLAEPDTAWSVVNDQDREDRGLDLDKAWQALGYLLPDSPTGPISVASTGTRRIRARRCCRP